MTTIVPNVIGLIFANRLEVAVEKDELSILGLFQNQSFKSFPTTPMEMTVFAMVNGGRGEGILRLAVYCLPEMEEHDESRDWIYRQSRWVKFPEDPIFAVHLEFRIKKLVFTKPGAHLFVLSFDGKLIADRRMSIHAEDSAT